MIAFPNESKLTRLLNHQSRATVLAQMLWTPIIAALQTNGPIDVTALHLACMAGTVALEGSTLWVEELRR
jgi:hypothetical protein